MENLIVGGISVLLFMYLIEALKKFGEPGLKI
jgi:hypothetical protein